MRRTRVILADPGWKFGDKLPGGGRGALKHYRCDSVADICNWLPDLISVGVVPPLADDAVLFMWRVASMQREALAVVRAWGFDDPTSEIPWVKTSRDESEGEMDALLDGLRPDDVGPLLRMGMGRTVRNCHEVALLCRRGKPARRDASVRSVLFGPRRGHSEKPEELQDRIERLYAGPYVELNARRQRPGWLCIGDAIDSPDLLNELSAEETTTP